MPGGLSNISGGTTGTFYDSGTVLSLTAATPVADGASKQWRFTAWSGDATGSTSPVAVTMSAARSVTATYVAQYQLTLAITAGVPGGLSNISGGTAGMFYDSGTVVNLTAATPVADGTGKRWRFNNWSGDATGGSNPVSVTMSAPRAVTANYVVQFLLTITTNPSVVARTNVTPADGWFDTGSPISLNATSPVAGGPGVGYVFKNWTGNAPSAPNASNPLSGVMDQARTIVANYTTLTLGWDAGVTFSAQYSDPTGLRAVLMSDGTALASKTINFSVGTNSGSGVTNSSGVATDSTLLTQAPGSSYTATASCSAAQCGVALSITHAYTITPEDARVTYAGNMFVGIPLSSTSGSITLIATIQDITAVTGDPAYDQYPGDIRNATVTFVNRDASNATLCTAAVLLVNGSDTRTGSVTCTFTGTVGSIGSTQYTVGIVVGGYYGRNASTENTVVTISQVGAGMITGGGYLVMQNSAGTIAGDPGTKNNFGFNVKYNKSGTNLQGNLNTIVRRRESDGNQHVYQIKGNSMTSLAVYQLVNNAWVAGCTGATSTSPCKAQFNGKANIQDITNPVAPFSVSGNNALQFNMTDYGSPGSSDTIGITLWNGSGGIWFSTNWVGSPPATAEQVLGGGNLEVH